MCLKSQNWDKLWDVMWPIDEEDDTRSFDVSVPLLRHSPGQTAIQESTFYSDHMIEHLLVCSVFEGEPGQAVLKPFVHHTLKGLEKVDEVMLSVFDSKVYLETKLVFRIVYAAMNFPCWALPLLMASMR